MVFGREGLRKIKKNNCRQGGIIIVVGQSSDDWLKAWSWRLSSVRLFSCHPLSENVVEVICVPGENNRPSRTRDRGPVRADRAEYAAQDDRGVCDARRVGVLSAYVSIVGSFSKPTTCWRLSFYTTNDDWQAGAMPVVRWRIRSTRFFSNCETRRLSSFLTIHHKRRILLSAAKGCLDLY